MNKQIVSITTALAIAAAGGFAYAQTDSTAQAANNNGVPGVEANIGANAKNDGGLPGVEMNVGADGDQKNVDTRTLGAGPSTMTDTTTTTTDSNTTNASPDLRVDRN